MTNERAAAGWDSLPGAETIDGVWAPNRGPVYGRRYAVATDQPATLLTQVQGTTYEFR